MALWTIMIFVSVIITVVALKKIYTICKTVTSSDESVKLNLNLLVIHAFMLVIFFLVIAPTNYAVSKDLFKYVWLIINTIDVII